MTSSAEAGAGDPTDLRARLVDEQTLAEREQTLSDADHSDADADQTAADSDQAAADADQAAANTDQAASDLNHARGGDDSVHRATSDARDRTAERRRHTALVRLDGAARRDKRAAQRDGAAAARDQAATARDELLDARDAAWAVRDLVMTGAEVIARASDNRRRAAADRAAAAAGRARGSVDRIQAAVDRERAARDREEARLDRESLLQQLATAQVDALTGARTRQAGLVELNAEIARARRTTGTLAAAYVDVVGMKAVTDTDGRAAGDAVLRRAAHALRAGLRPYDLIVRLSGDEFLCVLSGTTTQEAAERVTAVRASLADGADSCELKVGIAELAPGDTASELIERADADLQGRPPVDS